MPPSVARGAIMSTHVSPVRLSSCVQGNTVTPLGGHVPDDDCFFLQSVGLYLHSGEQEKTCSLRAV